MGARLCVCGSVCACACLVRVSRLFVLRVSVGACLSAFEFLCVNKQIIPNTFFFSEFEHFGTRTAHARQSEPQKHCCDITQSTSPFSVDQSGLGLVCICALGWGWALAYRLTLTGNTTKELSTCGWMHPYDCWTHIQQQKKKTRKRRTSVGQRRWHVAHRDARVGREGSERGAHAIQNRQQA